MSKKINFSVEKFDFLEEDPDSQFATVEIECFSSGENRHELTCPVELLKSTAPTIDHKPIVFEIDRTMNDFGSHVDYEEDREIAGFILPNTREFFERNDGRISLKVQGKIWKLYAQRAMEVFKSSVNMAKKVSVEMLMGDPDGNVMTDFAYTAVAVLGDFLTEASPGAQARIVSFSEEDYNKAYKAEFAKYSSIDFAIPQGVKDNCRDGLAIYEEFGTGGTSVSLAMARFVVKNDKITEQKVRKMAKYFGVRGGRNKPEDFESNAYTSWMLYGGQSGFEWSQETVDKMNVADEDLVAYFEKLPLADGAKEGKEIDSMGKDKKDEKDFAEVKPEDEEVSMGAEEDKEEEMAAPEGDEKEDMAKPDDEEEMAAPEEKEEMGGMPKEEMAEADEEEEPEEKEEDMAALFADAKERIETLESEKSGLVSENTSLREFKSGIEKEQFGLRVDKILSEVKEFFSDDEIKEARKDALENYSLDTVDGWSNLLKAKAFEAGKNSPPNDDDIKPDDGILKMDIVRNKEEKAESTTLW